MRLQFAVLQQIASIARLRSESQTFFGNAENGPISAADRHRKVIRFSARCSAYRILIRFRGIETQAG